MRLRSFVPALLLTLTCQGAIAAPIQPAKDKAGALAAYIRLSTTDRRATLEAFSGTSMADITTFEKLDACVLREGNEPSATRARLLQTITACKVEAGIRGGTPAAAAVEAPAATTTKRPPSERRKSTAERRRPSHSAHPTASAPATGEPAASAPAPSEPAASAPPASQPAASPPAAN